MTTTLAPPTPAAPPPAAPGPRSIASPPVLLALFTVLAGLVAGALLLAPQPPPEDSASVGFARDMSRHHAQAVAMAEALRDRTDDPELRSLTQDIALTQQAQLGMMTAWLDDWGYATTTSGPRMAWMGMSVEGLMPGMATPEAVQLLASVPLDEAEDRFLALMVAHHSAGVDMAEAAVALAEQPQVVRLASGIAAAQASEIDYLQALRAQRGLPPADVPASTGHDLAADHHGGGLTARDAVLWSVVAAGVVAFLWLLLDTVLRRSGVTQRRLDAVALTVVAGAVVSSAVHLVLTPSHAEQSVAYGVFFLLAALALALGAAAVLAGSTVPGAALVAGTGVFLLVTYVFFRLVPAPGAEAPEGVDGWGVLAVSAQVVAVLAAAALLRRRRSPLVA